MIWVGVKFYFEFFEVVVGECGVVVVVCELLVNFEFIVVFFVSVEVVGLFDEVVFVVVIEEFGFFLLDFYVMIFFEIGFF